MFHVHMYVHTYTPYVYIHNLNAHITDINTLVDIVDIHCKCFRKAQIAYVDISLVIYHVQLRLDDSLRYRCT